jgi:hypothetical protein
VKAPTLLEQTAFFVECIQKCARKLFDMADVVRDCRHTLIWSPGRCIDVSEPTLSSDDMKSRCDVGV